MRDKGSQPLAYTHTHTHTHTHMHDGSIICSILMATYSLLCKPVYNLQELCDEVSLLGKLLLKRDHHQRRDLPHEVEGPIIPRSHPVVQYPCHHLQYHHVLCVCVCVCVCVYIMCQCVHVWQSCEKGNGQTQGIISANHGTASVLS